MTDKIWGMEIKQFEFTPNKIYLDNINLIPDLTDKQFTLEFSANFSYDTLFPNLPEFRKATDHIEEGRYKPRELGISLPGVLAVNVGACILHKHPWNETEIAHAHPSGEICVRDGRYIRYNGKTDKVMHHEYAHVLAGVGEGHGPKWKEIADRMDAGWLKSPYIYYG